MAAMGFEIHPKSKPMSTVISESVQRRRSTLVMVQLGLGRISTKALNLSNLSVLQAGSTEA